jgi:hypothetical protein
MDDSFGGKMNKWLAITTVIGSLVACGRGGSSSPIAPTPPAPPANIAGPYSANIIASSTCSANLPSETRALGFVATITQTGAAVQVQLVAHIPGAPSVTVSGTVSGQTVNFPSLSFSETIGRGAALVASGNASVGANGSITGTLSGTYQTPSGSSCNAANHQLEMVKLCEQKVDQGVALLPCAGI